MPPAKKTAAKRKPPAKKASGGRTTPRAPQAPRITGKSVAAALRKNALRPHEVVEIYGLCAEILSEGAAGIRWRIDLDPIQVHFGEDDLTWEMTTWCEMRTGTPMRNFDLEGNATHLMAVVLAFLHFGAGWELEEAERMCKTIPLNEARACLTTEAVGPDPKEPRVWRSAIGT